MTKPEDDLSSGMAQGMATPSGSLNVAGMQAEIDRAHGRVDVGGKRGRFGEEHRGALKMVYEALVCLDEEPSQPRGMPHYGIDMRGVVWLDSAQWVTAWCVATGLDAKREQHRISGPIEDIFTQNECMLVLVSSGDYDDISRPSATLIAASQARVSFDPQQRPEAMSSIETGSDRPHKRPREDAPSVLPSSAFTASKDIWYEDGNIILVCESVGFRVFKGILSSQSEVFRDMFSVGNPSADKTFDGCAVVNLFDSADDVLPFLRTLYDRDYGRPSVCDVPRHDLPFGTIAGILRMATKYLVRGLRKEMVDDLKNIFPSKISDLIDFHDGRSLIPDFNGIIAVNIAIECRIPIILLVAYYYCSLLSLETLVEGFQLASGVVVKLSSTTLFIALTLRERALAEILRSDRISRIRESQKNFWGCPYRECTMDPVVAALNVEASYLDWSNDGVFTSSRFSEEYSSTLCKHCYDLVSADETDLRHKIWHLLPMLCGEKSWEAVKEKQEQNDRCDEDV